MNRIFIAALPEETGLKKYIGGSEIMYSGVGKINATIAAYSAIKIGYKEIINIGSCGSTHLPVGELVKVGIVYQDIDCTPLCEYGNTLGEVNGTQIVLDSENYLSTCFTTDYFYDHKQKDKYSKQYLDMIESCSIFDMECFAMAKVCKKMNVKFSSYKWVSDNGDGSDWKENCKLGFQKVIKYYEI